MNTEKIHDFSPPFGHLSLCSFCGKKYTTLDFQIYSLKTSADEFTSRTIFLIFKVMDMLLSPQTNTPYRNKAKHNYTPTRQNNVNKYSSALNYGEKNFPIK